MSSGKLELKILKLAWEGYTAFGTPLLWALPQLAPDGKDDEGLKGATRAALQPLAEVGVSLLEYWEEEAKDYGYDLGR